MEFIKWFNRTRAKANVWGFGAGLLLSNFGILKDIFKELSSLDERVAKLDENGAKQEKIDTFFRVVERIVRYKNEKPQKFEELFADLNALCQKRKNNAEIDEYLKEKFFD